MTHEQMQEQAAHLVAFLEPEKVAEFAEVVKHAIMNSYNDEQLKIIADQLELAGIIISGIPCKRIPA
jgi:hypothetical protein